MDDVEMNMPNGSPSTTSPTAFPSAISDPDPAPTTTRRKSVSFPDTAEPPHATKDSPATAKILARKPTPFNSDLAATIRESGFGAVMTEDQDSRPQDSADSTAEPTNPRVNFDIIGEVCEEEEEVDPEEAERARQISLGRARPPPTAPSS